MSLTPCSMSRLITLPNCLPSAWNWSACYSCSSSHVFKKGEFGSSGPNQIDHSVLSHVPLIISVLDPYLCFSSTALLYRHGINKRYNSCLSSYGAHPRSPPSLRYFQEDLGYRASTAIHATTAFHAVRRYCPSSSDSRSRTSNWEAEFEKQGQRGRWACSVRELMFHPIAMLPD